MTNPLSFEDPQSMTAETVAEVAQAERGRWKIESAPQAHRKEARDELMNCA
jgi:hypothetical protein